MVLSSTKTSLLVSSVGVFSTSYKSTDHRVILPFAFLAPFSESQYETFSFVTKWAAPLPLCSPIPPALLSDMRKKKTSCFKRNEGKCVFTVIKMSGGGGDRGTKL